MTHYSWWKSGKDLSTTVEPRRSKGQPKPSCTVDGCDRAAVDPNADCLCDTHWKQQNLYQIELRPPKAWSPVVGMCSFAGCSSVNERAGLCGKHYDQNYRGRKLTNEFLRGSFPPGFICTIAECDKPVCSSRLLCKTHDSLCWVYKLTSVQLEMLWAGGCAICGSTQRLHIDHDHACCDKKASGKKDTCGECVRGCLCSYCNHGLGNFRDSIAALNGAIAYLSAA